MYRHELKDLTAFALLAKERSFTRAASLLGISASALSHAINSLEHRLGMRLLTRTTRSVSTTQAGEQLLQTLRPALESIDAGLSALADLRETPSGTVRVTTLKHAAKSLLWPLLPNFLRDFPHIKVEIAIDNAYTDIVAKRFDFGIRFDRSVDQDMIALPLGDDIAVSMVASPDYLLKYHAPATPDDLVHHACINYRLENSGDIHAWDFEKDGKRYRVKVDGPLVLNDGDMIVQAAIEGFGIGSAFDSDIVEHVRVGRLVRVLEQWRPTYPGYQIYYPSRRHMPIAARALLDALSERWNAPVGKRRPRTY